MGRGIATNRRARRRSPPERQSRRGRKRWARVSEPRRRVPAGPRLRPTREMWSATRIFPLRRVLYVAASCRTVVSSYCRSSVATSLGPRLAAAVPRPCRLLHRHTPVGRTVAAAMAGYSTVERGQPNTLEYKIYFGKRVRLFTLYC